MTTDTQPPAVEGAPAATPAAPAGGVSRRQRRRERRERRRKRRKRLQYLVLGGLALAFSTLGIVFVDYLTSDWRADLAEGPRAAEAPDPDAEEAPHAAEAPRAAEASRMADASRFGEDDAYWLCMTMLEHVSSDPAKAVIPRVKNTGVGSDFHFVWSDSTRLLYVPTAPDLKAATTGSCTVNAARHEVSSLILDGKALR